MLKLSTMALGAALLGLGLATAAELRAEVGKAPRVVKARQARGEQVQQLFVDKGLPYPPPVMFLRAFKHEDQIELWAGRKGEALVLVKTFAVCAKSGALGPKRRRGDLQVPEGFYHIVHFQPWSNFHLSMKVNYPNPSDRILGYKRDPGGDIFIHGSCVTIGCLPIEDGPIEELFLAALDADRAAKRRVPVHIFPTRMDEAGMARLEQLAADGAPHLKFWKGLKPGYDAFERTRKVPRVWVDEKTGGYRFKAVE